MRPMIKFTVLGVDLVKEALIERDYIENTEDNSWEKSVPEDEMRKESMWLTSHCMEYKVTSVE